MIQTIEASKARRVISASASPTCRARFWRSGGNRPATIAINTRLSMPSTISRAVSVTRLAQICGSVSQSIPALSRSLAAHKIRRNNLQLAQCQRLHPSARRWHRVAAGNPRADLGCVKQQDAAHLLDRVRVRLYRVSGADDVFGIHTVEMRARIFDDTVVAALDRPIAFNRDDRMRVDTGSNRRNGHRLQDRVVWRHPEQAARPQIARVDLEVAGVAREVGTRSGGCALGG